MFRGKYLAGLQAAFGWGTLRFAGRVVGLADPAAFRAFVDDLRATDWVVYAKPPFAGPTQVLEYLGRYTHRVAISNDHLLSLDDGQVEFRWQDYTHGNRLETMRPAVDEFLRRFLLHVLPGGFVRLRHFGFLATRGRRSQLAQCRTLLAAVPPEPPVVEPVAALLLRLTGVDLTHCPVCHVGRLRLLATLRPGTRPVPAFDTS